MLPNARATSISTNAIAWLAHEVRALLASWRAKSVERFRTVSLGGYLLLWIMGPIFPLIIIALIYADRPDLQRYTVVTLAAQSLISSAIFYIGEILDRERMNGTLVALFLAPCARFSWLSGFTLVGIVETVVHATVSLLFGHTVLGVRFDPDLPALVLTLVLFVAALWGLGFVFSAIGLLIKKANPFSNVVFPIIILLGGAYYPVALLPDWLRYPALALPFGYAMQALADATLNHASIADLAPNLIPLALFALVLPGAGILAFRWIERLVRERGELDLY
jgi:ABC-2 type transport system permease protein